MAQRTWLQQFAYVLARHSARLVYVVVFGGRSRGREHFPATGGALICANHQSHFDPILLGLLCDRRLNYLARESLFANRWFGWFLRFWDAVPIRRDGVGVSGLKESLRRLKRGEMLLVFPEGTRTRDGEISELKPGFCALARRTKVPIIPVAYDGPYQAWPRSQLLPSAARVHSIIGEPIDPETIAGWSDEELVAEVRRRITEGHRQVRASRRRT